MGGHIDNAELTPLQPIVSISLGCEAVFLIGGKSRTDPKIVGVRVRSGDVVVMGGETRACLHGVPRIWKDSMPERFKKLKEFMEWKKHKEDDKRKKGKEGGKGNEKTEEKEGKGEKEEEEEKTNESISSSCSSSSSSSSSSFPFSSSDLVSLESFRDSFVSRCDLKDDDEFLLLLTYLSRSRLNVNARQVEDEHHTFEMIEKIRAELKDLPTRQEGTGMGLLQMAAATNQTGLQSAADADGSTRTSMGMSMSMGMDTGVGMSMSMADQHSDGEEEEEEEEEEQVKR